MKVYKTPCKNCLFHKDRIVDTERAGHIISDCRETDRHFICHVPSEGDGYSTGDHDKEKEAVCAGFYQQFRDPDSPLHGTGAVLRLATAFGAIEMIDQPKGRQKLTPARKWGNP